MDGSKHIMEQVHVYENLCADVISEGMKLCDVFLANVLLEKFPSSWTDYRNHLKHKKKDLTLEELVSHMRTEEANRLKDKPVSVTTNTAKVNLVESGGSSMLENSPGQSRGHGQFKGRGRGRGRGRGSKVVMLVRVRTMVMRSLLNPYPKFRNLLLFLVVLFVVKTVIKPFSVLKGRVMSLILLRLMMLLLLLWLRLI